MVTGVSYPGVKWLGRETERSTPSSVDVKIPCNYTSTPQYVIMMQYLIKQTRLHGVYLVQHKTPSHFILFYCISVTVTSYKK